MELSRRDLLKSGGAVMTLSLIPKWLVGKVSPTVAEGNVGTGYVVLLSKLQFTEDIRSYGGNVGRSILISVPIGRDMLREPDITGIVAGKFAESLRLCRKLEIRPDAPPLESIEFRALYGLSGIPAEEVSRLSMRSLADVPSLRESIKPLRLEEIGNRGRRECPSCGCQLWADSHRCPACNFGPTRPRKDVHLFA